MIDLSPDKRNTVLDAIKSTVREKFYDPQLNGVDWNTEVETRREGIIRAADEVEFEKLVNDLLKCLGASHTGLIHDSVRRATAKMALSATFFNYENRGERHWMFQDVHEGGPAQLAGVKPGDLLLRVGYKQIRPPEAPLFPMGATSRLLVSSASGQERIVEIQVPDPKSKKNPVIVPKLVTARRMDKGIGQLKVSMFPGILGVEVAQKISAAAQELDCERLVIDLRGNPGGGMGSLRLMSLLVPGQEPVGYSLTRKRALTGFERERLPKLDRIPSRKSGVLPLILKFAFGDKSIAVFTEGIGQQRFHNRVVLLTNEHSASASEMVAAFAVGSGSAHLTGEKTPGRVVGANSFKVGHGYRVALPIVAYHTWDGEILEGRGITPGAHVAFDPESARSGADEQLRSALEQAEKL